MEREPIGIVARLPLLGGLSEEGKVMRGVAAGRFLASARSRQLLRRIGARHVEQAVPGGMDAAVSHYQGLRDEIAETGCDVDSPSVGSHRPRSLHRELLVEQRQMAEHEALGFVQERVAPVKGRVQGLVARERRAPPSCQSIEAVPQRDGKPLDPQAVDLGGSQLDG